MSLFKICEACIEKNKRFLPCHDLKFSYVKVGDCKRACFVLKSIASYFTSSGANIFIAAFDASKAFDWVHFAMLTKM